MNVTLFEGVHKKIETITQGKLFICIYKMKIYKTFYVYF